MRTLPSSPSCLSRKRGERDQWLVPSVEDTFFSARLQQFGSRGHLKASRLNQVNPSNKCIKHPRVRKTSLLWELARKAYGFACSYFLNLRAHVRSQLSLVMHWPMPQLARRPPSRLFQPFLRNGNRALRQNRKKVFPMESGRQV